MTHKPTMAQIDQAVMRRLGPCRVEGNAQPMALYREIAMWFMVRAGRWSTPQIGRYYNGRHHTTVLYAVKRIEYLMRADAAVAAMVTSVSEELGGEAPAESSQALFEERLAERIASKVAERLLLAVTARETGGTCGAGA